MCIPIEQSQLFPILEKVEAWIESKHHTFTPQTITVQDIMLSSVLWGLYVLPEFQFSPEIHHYLQHLKRKCHFEYHRDFWQS